MKTSAVLVRIQDVVPESHVAVKTGNGSDPDIMQISWNVHVWVLGRTSLEPGKPPSAEQSLPNSTRPLANTNFNQDTWPASLAVYASKANGMRYWVAIVNWSLSQSVN